MKNILRTNAEPMSVSNIIFTMGEVGLRLRKSLNGANRSILFSIDRSRNFSANMILSCSLFPMQQNRSWSTHLGNCRS